MAKDFWSELGRTISNATKKAAENTGSLMDAAKIRGKISNEHKEIDKLYRRLGESFMRRAGGDFSSMSEEDRAAAEEILAHRELIRSFTEELAALKGMKVCPECGELIDLGAVFCPKCGTKTPVGPREVKPEELTPDEPEEAGADEADEAEAEEVLDAEYQPLTDESVPSQDETVNADFEVVEDAGSGEAPEEACACAAADEAEAAPEEAPAEAETVPEEAPAEEEAAPEKAPAEAEAAPEEAPTEAE